MIQISEARSFSNGIEFYTKHRNKTISAKRCPDGKIVVEEKDYGLGLIDAKSSKFSYVIIYVVSVMFGISTKGVVDRKLEIMLIIAFIWLVITLMYITDYHDPRKFSSFRYHAAEHMVVNYIEKYDKIPDSCEALKNITPVSIRCGSTAIAVKLILLTMVVYGVLFVPGILLKIVWCVFSTLFTCYLWIKGWCNFFQKLVLKTPSEDELQVALEGVKKYVEIGE